MNKKLLKKIVQTTKSLTILYIEDDEDMLVVVSDMLESMFKKVDIATNGEEALVKFNEDTYDLIITDIIMPKMNGIELIEHVRQKNRFIPILILSAFNDTEHFLKTIKLGIDGYLLKPLEFNQFMKTLVKVVERIELEKLNLMYKNELEAKVEIKTAALRHKCFHEFYTDLPNSIMLLEDLQQQKYSHIMLLDMSHFSVINKEYGKTFANHVIVRTARMLEKHIHKKSMLYKVESDRFIIGLQESSESKIAEYCEQLISFFDNKNVKVDDAELHITFNIGVSTIGEDPSEALINSEYALEKSKHMGSRHYELFDESTSYFDGAKEAIKQLRDTRRLVLEEKIIPYFQPIKDIQKDEILKYEVLARGVLDGEVILPEKFISAAEQLGFITSITRQMINKSFEFFKDNEYSFSINITERDLLDGYLGKFLSEKLKVYNIDSNRVTFEILEHITISQNGEAITRELSRLKEMGFSLAVDDFGIENSNFSRLLDTNVDYLKIDGMFIKDLKENEEHRKITRAIVNLSKTLGIKTVAEYVEDEDIYNMVKECGVDYAQGYYLGHPSAGLIV